MLRVPRLVAAGARARPHQVVPLVLPAARSSALVVAGVGIWRVRARAVELPAPRVLLAVGLFGLGIMPQALQRPDTTHLAWVSCVPLALPPGRHRRAARRTWPPSLRRRCRTALAVAAGDRGCSLAVIPHFTVPHLRRPHRARRFGQQRVRLPRAARRSGLLPRQRARRPTAANAARRGPRRSRRSRASGCSSAPPTCARRRTRDAYLYYLFPELSRPPTTSRWIPGMANATGSGLAGEVASADWLDPVPRLGRLGRAERLAQLRLRRAERGRPPGASAWSGTYGGTPALTDVRSSTGG